MHSSRWILLVAVLIIGVVLVPGIPASGQPRPGEYQAKSAFLLNFFTFVDWPPEVKKQAEIVRVCVLGDLPAGQGFNDLNYSTVWNKTLLVSPVTSSDDYRRCQVLFISSTEERRLPRILEELKGKYILTVGDTSGFARRGVMINFYFEGKKVRFEINAAAAEKAGLVISAKLLKLAGAVYGISPGGE